MVIEHIVKGSMETSLHTFSLQVDHMALVISEGAYYQNNIERFSTNEETRITIQAEGYYEIWITTTGFQVIKRVTGFEEAENAIDRLMWFSVPTDTTDLSEIDIHFVKVTKG